MNLACQHLDGFQFRLIWLATPNRKIMSDVKMVSRLPLLRSHKSANCTLFTGVRTCQQLNDALYAWLALKCLGFALISSEAWSVQPGSRWTCQRPLGFANSVQLERCRVQLRSPSFHFPHIEGVSTKGPQI